MIDETPGSGESALAPSRRLAQRKAETIADRYPEATVISTDQAAEVDGIILGKPGTQEHACAMLQKLSGRNSVFFHLRYDPAQRILPGFTPKKLS